MSKVVRSSRARLSIALVASLALAALAASPAAAATIDAGVLTPGVQVIAAPTNLTDELVYHITVPANAHLTLAAADSTNPMIVNLAPYDVTNGFSAWLGPGLLGNTDPWSRFFDLAPQPQNRDIELRLTPQLYSALGTLPFTAALVTDPPTQALTFGTPTTATVAVPGQELNFTVGGIAGHRMGVRVSDATFAPGTYALFAIGADQPYFRRFLSPDLPSSPLDMADTQYTLHVDPTAAGVGQLTITVVDVADLTTPLTLGTTYTANLADPWAAVRMPFTELPNAHLRLDVLSNTMAHADGSPGNVSAYVSGGGLNGIPNYSDFGNLTSAATTVNDDRIMTQAAPSTLGIMADGLSTGTITFALSAVPETAAAPITLDSSTTVALDTAWQSASYSFAATSGQRFSATTSNVNLATAGGAGSFALQLIAPDGTVTTVGSDFTTNGPAGTWILRIDPFRDSTGTLTLIVSPAPVVTVPVILGRTATASTTKPNATINFTNPGARGAATPMVVVRSLSMSDSTGAEVSVPVQFVQGGVILGYPVTMTPSNYLNYSFMAPPELDPTAPWSLMVLPGATTTGSIGLSVLTPITTTKTVKSGAATTVNFRGVGDVTDLRVSLTAGQRVLLQVPGTPTTLTVDQVAPDGTFQTGGYLANTLEMPTAATTGWCVLRFRLADGSVYGGTYSITPTVVTDPLYKAGEGGTTKVKWGLGQHPRITVDGKALKHLTLDLTNVSNGTFISVAVYNPSGMDITRRSVRWATRASS
jgi:hypothetical protein